MAKKTLDTINSAMNAHYEKLQKELNDFKNHFRNTQTKTIFGKVIAAIGTTIRASIPNPKIGDMCQLIDKANNLQLTAEIIAINNDEAILLPFGSIDNISKNALIIKSATHFKIQVGDFLIGKVVDGLGNIIDNLIANDSPEDEEKQASFSYQIVKSAPDPLKRPLVNEKLITGITAIDMFLTCGKGQRLAIFAGPGIGKTVLIGMIIRNTEADVIVIALVGERGREVREFIDLELNESMRKKCVLVYATSDKPPVEQIKCAYTAHTIAEYFRDQGKNVIIFVDSITRFARAQREIGISAGEPIARGGYPPSVFQSFPKLLERAGNNEHGSITAFYTVLMEGENTQNDPIADEIRSIVDGHIILSKKLADQGHFPAINILSSLSRIADRLIDEEHIKAARKVRLLLSKYEELEFLIRIGEYQKGSDSLADEAILKNNIILKFLQQGIHEKSSFDIQLKQLIKLSK